MRECESCEGSGTQWMDCASPIDHEHDQREVECEDCGGSGEIDDDDEMEASE